MDKHKITKKIFNEFLKWHKSLPKAKVQYEHIYDEWWELLKKQNVDRFRTAVQALCEEFEGDFEVDLILNKISSLEASEYAQKRSVYNFDLNALSHSERSEEKNKMQWRKLIELVGKIDKHRGFDSEDYYLFHVKLHGMEESMKIGDRISNHFPEMGIWQRANQDKMLEALEEVK